MAIQKKICVLGDFAIGKTSLIRRFVEGRFDESYLSTIGTHISRKPLTLAGQDLVLLIWDLAGGDKFSAVMASYYRGAAGALLVCDLTRSETLTTLERYAQEFWSVNPRTPYVVVGNKVDLVDQRTISDTELKTFAEKLQAPWFTSSAKTGENVETIFATLGALMLGVPYKS